jgi:thymidylate synthase (FAD)
MANLPEGYIPVLDKGYVGVVNYMGSDHSVTQAARVSFDKRTTPNNDGSLSAGDKRLLNFLWKNNHTSPFRNCSISFEVNAPLFVARQHWKHHVASTYVDDQNGWNEMSKRYVTDIPEFYIPAYNEWRSSPENMKQGSGKPLEDGTEWTKALEDYAEKGQELYEAAMNAGIAAEQARLFLPAYSMYIKYYWTTSLHGLMNFLSLRLPKDAQYEIVQYAKAVKELSQEIFPESISLLPEN